MSYEQYSGLLFEISQRLDQLNQHEHLLFMCRSRVVSTPENIPDALSLLQELEEQNNLAIDQVELLKDLLRGVGEWSLCQKVTKFEDKRKDYKKLIEQISRALDESNQLQQLIAVCIERGTLEENERNTQIGRIFFEKLEHRGHVAFGRLAFLRGILSEIERQDLVKKVHDFEKRRTDEDEFERRKAQAGSIVAAARVVGGRVIGVLNLKTACRVAAAGITLFTVREILNRWSTYDQLVTCFQNCVLPAGSRLIAVGQGCVYFTIQADNLMGLTALWNMYEDRTLKERLFDFFVTDEMKTRAGGEENVELTVTIEREEYEKAYFELVQEAEGNQRRIPERGVRRHSDSVLSVPPRIDKTLPVTLTQVKHQVLSLEERMDVIDPQVMPLENGNSWQRQARNRRLSDSFLLLKPNQDKVLLMKLAQLENKIKLLEERVEILEKARPIDASSEGLDQNVSYEWLGKGLQRTRDIRTKMYVDNLQFDTQSLITETTDSGLEIEGAPSEFSMDISDDCDTQTVMDNERLSLALQNENFAIVDDMLSRGPDVDVNTALMIAASSGNREAVNYLLRKGADPLAKGQFGKNALHFASQSGNIAVMEILIYRGVDVDSKDSHGNTPLMKAAASGKVEAVGILLAEGADPFVENDMGRNVLHCSSQTGNVAIIEKVMLHGLDVDSKDSDGTTPLMLAAAVGKIETFNYLLDKGAASDNETQFGENVMHYASHGGDVAIIQKIISRGLQVDSKGRYGNTPLMRAAASGKIEAVNFLLEKGADPFVKNQSGRNLLHFASKAGNITIIETILSRGLDVDCKDSNGTTPLMLAVADSQIDVVNYLLDNRADFFMRSQTGENLLHLASYGGNVTVITKMLSLGLDVNSKDMFRRTPLEIAQKNGKMEAANFLRSMGGH